MIQQAQQTDAEALTNVAHRSKQYWGYTDEQIGKWSDGLTITPEFIESNMVYCFKEQEKIVAFYALMKIGEAEMELEHFWMLPDSIGKGKGKILFAHMKRTLVAVGANAVKIVSDPNAKEFYEKCGAVYQGEHLSPDSGRYLPVLRLDVT